MADLTITATSGKQADTSGATETGILGETVTAGMSMYFDGSSQTWFKALASGTITQAGCAGIALDSGSTGQTVAILTKGNLTIGATVVKGKFYIVSDTAGKICPIDDVTTAAHFVTLLGQATSTTAIAVSIFATGVTY